jgi:hypothetical protein
MGSIKKFVLFFMREENKQGEGSELEKDVVESNDNNYKN